jgi:beta-1,2-mannobiose phosphorylase / 1,2-beta-oligomannan phosphorylase
MDEIQAARFSLHRYPGNPILSPIEDSPWEGEVTTNPGAWRDTATGEVFLLYRAAGSDKEHRVHFGLAVSKDGFHFTRVGDKPVLSPLPSASDGGCVEDPRIIKVGDWYFVTAATRAFPPGRYWTFNDNMAKPCAGLPDDFPAALSSNLTTTQLYLTRDFKDWIRAGRLTNPRLDDRDVVIFPERVAGRWVTLHRPMQWHGEGFENPYPAIWIAMSEDLLEWKQPRLLAMGEHAWERKIGANNPPLKTSAGWLQIFHGVGPDKRYRLGAFLLDLDDPSVITHRTPAPIYEPEADYEVRGIYNGVCFPCGHVVIDGTYFLYYGGADVHCCLATTGLEDLLEHLLAHPVK